MRAGATAVPGGVTRAGAAQRGQASVELVALAPLLVVVVLAAAQLLAAGAARVLADHAAEAAGIALLQGGDPVAAARSAVPGWSRARLAVEVRGRHVRVRLRPPAPVAALGGLLEARRDADAGPAP
jgi:hypothetical protein